MDINKTVNKGVLEIAIKGELDAGSSIQLDDAIKQALDEKQYKLLFNCSSLDYISSAGLGVFISYIEDFRKKKGDFAFYSMNDTVFDVFKLLGLDKVVFIANSQNEANQYLNEN